MSENWLSYNPTEVVIDIKTKKLETQVEPRIINLTDSEITSKLADVDVTKPAELVIMEYTKAVHKVISVFLEICAQKSISKPKILVDKSNLSLTKGFFSDPSVTISQFDNSQLSNANLIFVGETEFDGLFGYNTMSTRLLRRFGKENMLEAYEKRNGNLPLPGEELKTMQVAKRFTEDFEISAIGIVSILPHFYTRDKLSMIPFGGTKEAMDYVLKAYGERQKIAIVSDGSRVLLR